MRGLRSLPSSARLHGQGLGRRGFATASQPRTWAPLSRFETDKRVDYADLINKIGQARKAAGRPLTYAEKILYSHLDEGEDGNVVRGSSQLRLRPRRIASHDVTAQMVFIQFMSAGLDAAAVPVTVHCDHLVVGRDGQQNDLPGALGLNKEVYDFIASACQRYQIGYWKPGSGIIHQTFLENYAFPGGLMTGTDSHTPNAGGLGMIAIGVGGADAVDVMAGLPFDVKAPNIIGVKLTGQLSGWAAPKDVITTLLGKIGVKGGTGSIVEYFGPGASTISTTGRATICNMGAETGATTSIFPFSTASADYLRATQRPELAEAAQYAGHELCADADAQYDQVVEIDLSTLEPRINGPFTPDLSHSISKFRSEVESNGWPSKLSAGLIGSCTNSSFEDLARAASIAEQALAAGISPKMEIFLTPGSEKTRETLKEAGILDVFAKLNSKVLTNACGPCAGQWDRQDTAKGTPNSILTSYNRNFTGRMDGNPKTHVFLSSPEIVMAKIFSDDLAFDPTRESLKTDSGEDFRFQPPQGEALPKGGYADADHVYTAPSAADPRSVEVQISPSSDRLQRLQPFKPWSGSDILDCPVLIKTVGKCTTDHITASGPWFRYRGHLENISNNTLIGAVNADNGECNAVTNRITGEPSTVPDAARDYQRRGIPWVVVADANYGEGSSREHAALQPRYLGGAAIIARSLARIHEGNLKKQGMLALTFADPADYDRVKSSDRLSILGLRDMAPGRNLRLRVRPTEGGEEWETELRHSYSEEQIGFFRAGSALNMMASRLTAGEATT